MTTTTKKYQVIYADPPWDFTKSSFILRKGGFNLNSLKTEVKKDWEKVYPTLSKEEIESLPIRDITEKDAICFMWTTDTHLPDAIKIMKSWGFNYKTIAFVWVKKEKSGKQVRMMAPWTNKGAEICLLGTKGQMTKYLGARNIAQVVEATRANHSKKPDIIAEEIVRMFPNCERIELFARDAKPGWDVWGNEVENDIQMTTQPKLTD